MKILKYGIYEHSPKVQYIKYANFKARIQLLSHAVVDPCPEYETKRLDRTGVWFYKKKEVRLNSLRYWYLSIVCKMSDADIVKYVKKYNPYKSLTIIE